MYDLYKKEVIPDDMDLIEFSNFHPMCTKCAAATCGRCIEIGSLISEMKIFFCKDKQTHGNCKIGK